MTSAPSLLYTLNDDLQALVARYQALLGANFAGAAVAVVDSQVGAVSLTARPNRQPINQALNMAIAVLLADAAADRDPRVRELVRRAIDILGEAHSLRSSRH